MDLGLEAAGYRLVEAIELDELARSSLRANREGRWPIIGEDIADAALHLRPEDLGLVSALDQGRRSHGGAHGSTHESGAQPDQGKTDRQ